MRRNYLCVPLGALLLLVLAGSPAQAFNEFVISCEGVESTGGGALRYQYTLQNTDAVFHTLERFYLGTNDLNAGNYTNWSAPTGFAAVALVTNWGTVPDHSIMYSSELKTPHGVTPPVLSFASAGVISWSGSVVVPPGGTVTFGYDNPHLSWDVEWLAEHPIGGIISQGFPAPEPIAGPTGVFTRGWIHSPGDQLDIPVIDNADTLYVPSGKTHTLHGVHSYNDIAWVDVGGTLYVTAYNGSGETGTLELQAPQILIQGTLDAFAAGWRDNEGPGTGGPSPPSGSGAGYGGRGGNSGHGGIGGPPYGEPGGTAVQKGSGGLVGPSTSGGHGGGAVVLNGTTVSVTGTITVDGQNGGNGTWGGGAGSGGGLLVLGQTVDIPGEVRSNGGNGGGGDWGGGAGAGGRIKVWGDMITLGGTLATAGGRGANGTFAGSGGGGGTIRVFYCSLDAAGSTIDVTGGAGGSGTFPGSAGATGSYDTDIAAAPTITSIVDVANDQGRWVRLSWKRSCYDIVDTSPQVTHYTIWRRIDPLPASSMPLLAGTWKERVLPSLYPPGDWDYVAEVPARGELNYNVVVPTLADSTAAGVHYTTFFVSAVTADPFLYWDSNPAAGYSVDNLAPAAPEGFQLVSTDLLGWEESPEEDLDYYAIYGSLSDTFDGSAVLIGYTVGTSMDVSGAIYQYYYATATDFAGNEGEAAFLPRTVGIGDQLQGRLGLSRPHPNPFLGATRIALDLPEQRRVLLRVYDIRGRLVRTLLNEDVARGSREYLWNSTDDQGAPVQPGIYFFRVTADDYEASQKVVLMQ